MKYKIAIALIALIVANQSFAQGIKSLTKGQKIVQLMSNTMTMKMEMMGQEVEQNMGMGTTSELSITDLQNGTAKIEMRQTKMKMSMSVMGQDVDYDSDKPGDNELSKQMGSSLNKLTIMTVNEKGIITNVEMDEEVKSMMKSNPMAGIASGQPIGFFVALPENATVNTAWTVSFGEDSSSNTIYNYTIKSIENGLATLSFTGSMNTNASGQTSGMDVSTKLKGTITGTLSVNTKTNIVTTRNSIMEMKGTMGMAGQSIPIDMKGTTEETYK